MVRFVEKSIEIFKIAKYFLFAISFILFAIGVIIVNNCFMLVGVNVLFLTCVLDELINVKKSFFVIVFYGVLWVFLISRPTIAMFKGMDWYTHSEKGLMWSLVSIFISILFIYIGSFFGKKYIEKKSNNKTEKIENKDNNFFKKNKKYIQIISLIVFAISYICKFYIECDKLKFMMNKNYEQFYTSYVCNVPGVITWISGLLITSLIIYLLTHPKKIDTYFILLLYMILYIPMLIIGERGSIVSAFIFIVLYIVYRNIHEPEEKWITKKMIIAFCGFMVVAILLLGIYNYLRSKEDVPSFNPFSIILDFFYKQGITYEVLNIGYEAIDKLPNKDERNYTFGGFIDYFKYNKISQKIFGTVPFEEGNNERKALESNSFSHAMSYATRGNEYIDGAGWGSSYLLEVYTDYGFIGVIIINLCIGFYLNVFIRIIEKNNIFSIIVLQSLTQLFLMPRAEAIIGIKFIIQISFWFPVIIVFGSTMFINKIKEKRIESKKAF